MALRDLRGQRASLTPRRLLFDAVSGGNTPGHLQDPLPRNHTQAGAMHQLARASLRVGKPHRNDLNPDGAGVDDFGRIRRSSRCDGTQGRNPRPKNRLHQTQEQTSEPPPKDGSGVTPHLEGLTPAPERGPNPAPKNLSHEHQFVHQKNNLSVTFPRTKGLRDSCVCLLYSAGTGICGDHRFAFH